MEKTDLRVIVIDDDTSIRKMFGFYFDDLGCYFKVAASGEEGLGFLKEETFHAAIVDIRMPDMVGTDFILKAYGIRPETKYFIHTGLIYYNIPDELAEIGITRDFVIQKPVSDINDIYRAIISQLEN